MPDIGFAAAMAIKAAVVVFLKERRERLLAVEAERAASAKHAKGSVVSADGIARSPHAGATIDGDVLQQPVKPRDVT